MWIRGLSQGVLIGMTIFMPLYFELVRHLSISQSGLVLIPMMVAMMIGAQSAGRMVSIVGRYKIFPDDRPADFLAGAVQPGDVGERAVADLDLRH